MNERHSRRTYVGRVISDKMTKTITVLVTTYKTHPLYHKRIQYRKKIKAHDQNQTAHLGDKVLIMETRPLSATKHFRLVKILETAVSL